MANLQHQYTAVEDVSAAEGCMLAAVMQLVSEALYHLSRSEPEEASKCLAQLYPFSPEYGSDTSTSLFTDREGLYATLTKYVAYGHAISQLADGIRPTEPVGPSDDLGSFVVAKTVGLVQAQRLRESR